MKRNHADRATSIHYFSCEKLFVAEKWKIASDKSGNTANIGSINHIADILSGNGMFSRLGEFWFDDYCYGKIIIPDGKNGTKKNTNLKDFVTYRNASLVVPKHNKAPETCKQRPQNESDNSKIPRYKNQIGSLDSSHCS